MLSSVPHTPRQYGTLFLQMPVSRGPLPSLLSFSSRFFFGCLPPSFNGRAASFSSLLCARFFFPPQIGQEERVLSIRLHLCNCFPSSFSLLHFFPSQQRCRRRVTFLFLPSRSVLLEEMEIIRVFFFFSSLNLSPAYPPSYISAST